MRVSVRAAWRGRERHKAAPMAHTDGRWYDEMYVMHGRGACGVERIGWSCAGHTFVAHLARHRDDAAALDDLADDRLPLLQGVRGGLHTQRVAV